MEYKYHVDIHRDYGFRESTVTEKFYTFDSAYERFIEQVDSMRKFKTLNCWSVSIWDCDRFCSRLVVDSTDFE